MCRQIEGWCALPDAQGLDCEGRQGGLGCFRPLAVVAIGAWGTVHPSTTCALIRLGITPAAVTPLLKKAVKIVAKHANVVARRRFAAARRGMPAGV